MTKADILKFNFQPGDFLLIKGDSFFSDGITWLTGGGKNGPSHVAVYVGGGDQGIVGAVKHGVSRDTVALMLEHAEYFSVRRIPDLTVAAVEKGKAELFAMLGKKYDKMQFSTLGLYLLIRKATGLEWSWLIKDVRLQYVCSAVAYKFAKACGFKFVQDEKTITPKDIFEDTRLAALMDVKVEK